MRLTVWFILTFITCSLCAQQGHEIILDIEGYKGDTVHLGHHFGNEKYLADSAARTAEGTFVFSGTDSLPGGMYLAVYPGQQKFFQFMVNTADQHFRINATKGREVATAEVKGSEENKLFFDYLRFLNEHRPKADMLRKKIRKAKDEDSKKVESWEKSLDALNKKVRKQQEKILENHPETLTATMIRINKEIDIPDFRGDKKTVQKKQFNYFRNHYFDNIDLQDPRLIRTPMMYQRINHFIENLTVQRPDSISKSIDIVLRKLEGNDEAFRFFLSHYLNKYVRSEIVGMDAIYVHLVDKYYAKGKAPWVDSTQLAELKKNARRFAPLLVGKTAPDIELQNRAGERFSLHDFESSFTVLFFWAPDCGHCQDAMPKMIDFYEKFRDKGVEVFAVCTKVQDEVQNCWDFIDKNKGMKQWLNLVDPMLKSHFSQLYDIRSTPKTFVLDREKTIITKKIGAKQLPEVMNKILDMKEKGNLSEFY